MSDLTRLPQGDFNMPPGVRAADIPGNDWEVDRLFFAHEAERNLSPDVARSTQEGLRSEAARVLGKITSKRKKLASRENGRKGGRPSNADKKAIRDSLVDGIPTIRKSGNREMMSETVLRIRQRL